MKKIKTFVLFLAVLAAAYKFILLKKPLMGLLLLIYPYGNWHCVGCSYCLSFYFAGFPFGFHRLQYAYGLFARAIPGVFCNFDVR